METDFGLPIGGIGAHPMKLFEISKGRTDHARVFDWFFGPF